MPPGQAWSARGRRGEPPIELDTMLDLTAAAEFEGVKFDGFDLFLFLPHVDIDSTRRRNQVAGRQGPRAESRDRLGGRADLGRPPAAGRRWDAERSGEVPRTGGKGCRIAKELRELGVRPDGVVRIDSACGVGPWSEDPRGNQRRIAETFREACKIAEDHGERLAAEGEICWGGMHSWKKMLDLLEMVDRPQTLGFQADMAHTLLYLMGYNAPEDALLPADFDWNDRQRFDEAYTILTAALRPWTIDFHVAQNDATVHGSGSHDKTGPALPAERPERQARHRPPCRLLAARLSGEPTKKIRHVCWDGCMFPNATMMKPQTWNDIWRAMVAVRDAHGWTGITHDSFPRSRVGTQFEDSSCILGRKRMHRLALLSTTGASNAFHAGAGNEVRSTWSKTCPNLSTSPSSAAASWAGRTPTPIARSTTSSRGSIKPVLKVCCARPEEKDKLEKFAKAWGYESMEFDWQKADRAQGYRPDRRLRAQHLHHDIVIAAAEAGKMVVCEKPLAMNAAEAEEMVAAVEKAGVANMVSFNYRRVPAISLAKQIIDEGRIGRPVPLPGHLQPGLHHLGRRAPGRHGPVAVGRQGGRLRRDRRPAGPLHRHGRMAQRPDPRRRRPTPRRSSRSGSTPRPARSSR